MSTDRHALWLCVTLTAGLVACGSEESTPEEPPPEESTSPEPPQPAAEPSEAATEAAPPEPAGDPVDLLRAVTTAVATSSAYRDRQTEVAKLFDGDLESAWNSRTDDLVGAWIDVRVPDDASVTSIAMTAGYTKVDGERDLFTGNQRVARVRVLREGEELGVFPLDVASRELQTLPVTGGGGTYRIELAEFQAGSHADWHEACVSELRVMGRAPGLQEGRRFPRSGVGALPAPEAAPTPPDREEFASALRQRTFEIRDRWGEWEEEVLTAIHSGQAPITGDDVSDFEETRRRHLGHVLELVAPIDAAAADGLRAALARQGAAPERYWEAHREDLDAIAAAFAAAVDYSGAADARCRWAKVHARLRLHRMATILSAPHDAWLADEEEAADRIAEIDLLFPEDPRTATRRLGRIDGPPFRSLQAEWDALGAQLAVIEQTCWPGE